ncbi:hypothetical protein HXX76_006707 [Chlamydomonas incerta]|uniref:Uncharacterized protein n=1 Tax=Chlamydomonas incerta TaxID=51695 RepID=A0A835T051_CHLIN|nr:hypothetical protein HXX76_006707 [Chlamydomonas incerta]|eukprot:KAG2436403.1 hypothetical protein HXX76_006707 [Chlamydomonas incerta]
MAADSPNPLPSGAGGAGSDSSASIDSTLLEMELERARASLRVATAGAPGRLSAEGSLGRLFGGASAIFGGQPAPGPGPRPGLAASREPSFAGLGPVPSTSKLASQPPGQHVSSRADTFQAGLGAIGEVSALLNTSLAGPVPATGAHGAAAAGRTGAVGSVGISGFVHSMQHAHAAFSVERAALEARCRAAEEALSAAERRHAATLEPLQSRVTTLESSMAAERQLCGQLQQQLQVELQRLRTATEAETAARAAEAAAREMLAASGQSLEMERRRADEAAAKAAVAARDFTSRIAGLEEERSGLAKQLKQEKEHASALHKQLREAQRQEQALLEKLGTSEGARQQQEMRLEAAAEQVSAMRSELQLLNAKLAARDKQLLQHVKDMEETQLAALRTELAAAQSRTQASEAAYSQLRGALAAVHSALGPQALAAAFGYSEQLLSGLSAGAAEYGSLADRLMAARVVAEEDGKAVVTRVKELVAMTRNLYMTAERREVALSTEMDSAMAALRQTNTDAEARLASCNTALRATAQRVEELTNHLQESRGRCGELDTAVQAARLALDVELRSGEGLRATVSELQAEVSRLRARVADAEGAERELSSSRDQVAQLQALTAALQAQVEQLGGLAERSGQAVETKDERIRELRTALAAAMDGASKAESQGNALLREKQEVADALEAERRRSADLESVVKASEQELERVRTEADNVEGVFAQLSQQVVEAARLAAAQAREMQQGGIGSDNNRDAAVHTSPMLLYATTEHLERASEDAASQLTALEAYLATRGYKSPGWQQRPGTASSRSGPWYDSAGRQGTHGQVAAEALVLADEIHEAPKLCVQALLACVRQVKTQQALTHQQLITAQQHLRSLLPEGSGMHTPTASGRSAGRALSAPSKSGASGQQPHNDAAQALPVHELAVAVAASADAARQVVTEATEATMKAEKQCESLASRLKKLEKELAQTQQTAAEAAQLKEKLASAEAELQHVKAAAQAEFGRVQNEVSKAFQVAEQVRGEIMAEADNRVRAVERAAAETTSRAESQAAAAIAALEARLREAEAARSDALSRADARIAAAEQATAAQSASTASLMASLQEEVNKARSLLDTAEADLRALRAERAAGLQHVTRLDEQLRRAAEEAARWRKSAAPRIRDRMVMLAKLRVLRRKRADLVERLAAERQRGAQLGAAAEARRLKLQQGAAQLRQLQIDNVHLSSRLQEAESRAARADALLPRMEDRRIALEQDRKAQAEKVAKLSGQLAEATKAAEAARKAEAAARKELDRVLREQLEPQQRRSATMLEELERAAAALQESQANATRLLQQGESLRAEVEELQHMLEQERDQAQEQLLAAARDVTERDALIADMRRQLAVAQAAAAAAAALLPAVQSGQLGDATAVQAHLIGQVGQLQAANVELEARRAAVEAELEVLRVRIGRAEAAGVARPATAITAHSMHTVYPAPQSGQAQVLALDSLGVRSLAGIGFHDAAAGRDDGTASIAGSYTRNDAAGNDVIAAKDQRIHELRAALASVMADRTVAQKEAATAREEAVRATTASAEAAARAAAEAETQSTRIRELQAEVEQAAANVNALQAALQEREQRHTAALEDLQLQLRRAIEVAEAQRAEELTAAHAEAAAQAEAREAWWRKELEGLEAREREAASQAEAHLRSEMGAADARSRADAEARETRWREEEARWKEDARAAEDRWREDMAALDLRSREALDAAERAAKQQLEDVRAQAQQQITALEQRLRAEASASDKRVRDAERAAAEAVARADERTRQAERAREQLSQMQTLHASAEEAVKQLTAQLRELQAGGSSAAQMAVAEAAALSATVDTLRREATLAKDTIDAHEQEVKRLRAQHETAAALGRTLTSQLQGLSEDLASARTRIGVLQTELAAQQAELDTLRQTNETLKASLAAAEDRHLDSEAQLVEAEQSLSRQQGLVRQVQSENERLHEQYKELQQQLQKLTQERRSALIASAAAAATTPLTAREGAASPATGSPTRSRAATAAATPGTAGWLGAASAARTPAASIAVSARGRQVAAALLAAAGSPGAESLGRAAAAVAGDLERQLLEATVGEMQTKLDALQADLFAAEARASQAEHNAQLLRMDLQAAETRVRAADGKVADLQAQLQAAAAGTAEDVGALRQHVLDLELQLEAQRDREQATQEAVARASARCEELQQQAVAAERRVEELAHACEDRDLEVGVLRAQLASASADRLVEGLQGQSQQASHVQSALELQARQQAILVDSLQAELQAILSRAEAADKALTDTRTAVDTLRAEAADAARQRDKAVAEANAAVETLARLRADSSKFAGRLSALEAELLETQAARDRAAAQIRAAEAQAEEERTEVRSLRRQLQALAEASQNSRSEGGAAVLQRVADLESALAAARQQARDAEDAVLEAAAAQVRASALETRTRELEVALTDAETRLAAALEAETRAAGSLVAQHEAARQEAQELQLQLRAAADKLALSQQQVQDRDVRLEGYAGQVASMSKQTEVLEAQLREVRQHLRAAMQERDEYRKQATASSLELEYSEGARTARHNDDTSSVDGGAPQLVGMLTENRDLLDKITTMHNKLKLARAKIAQLEHAVRSCDAERQLLHRQGPASSPAAQYTILGLW